MTTYSRKHNVCCDVLRRPVEIKDRNLAIIGIGLHSIVWVGLGISGVMNSEFVFGSIYASLFGGGLWMSLMVCYLFCVPALITLRMNERIRRVNEYRWLYRVGRSFLVAEVVLLAIPIVIPILFIAVLAIGNQF
jgi:hypothetical protein